MYNIIANQKSILFGIPSHIPNDAPPNTHTPARNADADAMYADADARPRTTWTSSALADALTRDARAVERYSRHLVLQPHGAQLQRALSRARVLVVGAGGLGCPTAMYLASSGVGVVGVCDGDVVELSNLHRQIGHGVARVGELKCASLKSTLEALNDGVHIVTHACFVTPENVVDLIREYDVVCDCTDNPRTRYMLSDACAGTTTPLVSAAAVGFEGQLSVYCAKREVIDDSVVRHTPAPCYRCVFPTPPAAGDRGTCGASGVLGVVPGVMGTLQALEATKTIAGIGESMCGKLLVFDSMSARPTTTLNVAAERNPKCVRCGDAHFDVAKYDYDAFLSTPCPTAFVARDDDRIARGGLDVHAALPHGPGASINAEMQASGPWTRVTPREFDARAFDCVVDVRPSRLYDVAHLEGSISIPIDALDGDTARAVLEKYIHANDDDEPIRKSVCFVCAGGNNSQRAADWFAQTETGKRARVYDLCGGLAAWRREVDATFPQLS